MSHNLARLQAELRTSEEACQAIQDELQGTQAKGLGVDTHQCLWLRTLQGHVSNTRARINILKATQQGPQQ